MSDKSRKIAEAVECVRKAEKSLKTGLLKWSPDYDIAASEYQSAATHFKHAKALRECQDCYNKASQCFRQNNAFFSAAKCLEQAGMVSRDMGDLMETANYVERACKLFQEHGSPDTAALCLDRGAKIIEAKHPERAVSLYMRAADVVLLEDRPRQAAEYLSKAARIQVKMNRIDEAIEIIKQEMDMHASAGNRAAHGRLVVVLVLLQLTREDYVAAEKAFQEGSGSLEDDELNTLSQLLEAYEQEDPEGLARAASDPYIVHMDVVYAKLARSLRIPGCISQMVESRPRTASTVTTGNTPMSTSYSGPPVNPPPVEKLSKDFESVSVSETFPPVAPAAPVAPAPHQPAGATGGGDDDDDEYEGGLC